MSQYDYEATEALLRRLLSKLGDTFSLVKELCRLMEIEFGEFDEKLKP